MRLKDLATWMSLLLVVVALGRPAPPAPARQTAARPAREVGSVPFDPELWSPANPTAGAVVFLVNPADAEIYVDGGYAGRPLQFSPARPLRLGAGQHRIELIATGYESARLDIAVLAGFVVDCSVVMTRR
jgi:hypothetical protein